jgi:hypothetical protein
LDGTAVQPLLIVRLQAVMLQHHLDRQLLFNVLDFHERLPDFKRLIARTIKRQG